MFFSNRLTRFCCVPVLILTWLGSGHTLALEKKSYSVSELTRLLQTYTADYHIHWPARPAQAALPYTWQTAIVPNSGRHLTYQTDQPSTYNVDIIQLVFDGQPVQVRILPENRAFSIWLTTPNLPLFSSVTFNDSAGQLITRAILYNWDNATVTRLKKRDRRVVAAATRPLATPLILDSQFKNSLIQHLDPTRLPERGIPLSVVADNRILSGQVRSENPETVMLTGTLVPCYRLRIDPDTNWFTAWFIGNMPFRFWISQDSAHDIVKSEQFTLRNFRVQPYKTWLVGREEFRIN